VIVLDTSVAVPAALPWHAAHRLARGALPAAKTRVIAQVAIETYSVLTRLPPPQRVTAGLARDYLRETFEFPPLCPAEKTYSDLLDRVAGEEITGGAVYDAIVAATAAESGATLLTRDRRATPTYRRVGVAYRFLD
jgi:predicted nucleic acid-binding protein